MKTGSQEQTKVGRRELISMLTIFVAAHAFLNYPQLVSEESMEAAWMEPIISGVIALMAFLIADTLFRKFFPRMDILEVVKTTFGKVVGVAFAVIVAAYFIWLTAFFMRQFAETVVTTVLPNTPIIVILFVFVLTVSYVATCGLEAIVRVGQLFFPVLALAIITMVVLTLNWWHPVLLFPILGSGVPTVLKSGLEDSTVFMNVFLLYIIYPHAQDYRDLRRVGVWSTIWAVLLLTGFILAYHMVFAPEEATKLSSPMYSMARLIHLGRFIQRVESVYVFIWVAAAVVKLSITLWAAAYVLSSAFTWPSYRPIIPAIGLLAFAGSFLGTDIVQVVRVEGDIQMTWMWIPVFVLPIVLLLFGAMIQRMRWRTRHV